MSTEIRENVLYVKNLGGFSLTWNGKQLAGYARSSESQFIYLIQLLIHNRKNGVTRDEIEEVLFEERDIEDIHHATRSVLYNSKKKLKTMGLPECDYIQKSKGVYRWTDEIEVVEDTDIFMQMYEMAEASDDADEKRALYLEAIHTYTGEFLPNQTSFVWVAQAARQYYQIFCECIEKVVPLLRENHDYMQMEELGLYAASISPLANWESITMEALVTLGRYEEAKTFYEKTVDLYMCEQGLRPSDKLMELLGQIGSKLEHSYAMLDDIQNELISGDTEINGGYMCTYPIFQGVYRMVQRMTERGGHSVYLMLCTIIDSKGNPMKEGKTLTELAERLGDAIRHSVRRSDAICRYGQGQYLVLLVNTTRENCSIVQKRINYHFVVGRQRTGIQYYVNSVILEQDQKLGGAQ